MNADHVVRAGQRIGKYILGEPIARGGMAEVWSARVEGPEGFVKDCALKFVLESFRGDSELERLFVNEARVAAQLQHANLVTVFDFDKIADPADPSGGRYYIAMERVDGYDLRRVGQDAQRLGRRLPPSVILHIAGEVLKGLRHVHERRNHQTHRALGLVHRDVSPHNILIGMGGEVKLSDFGIAKAMAQSFGTQSGLIRGKLAYASPEQLRNEPLDHRTDQFALGVTLWEGLAGRRLFDGADAREIIAKVGVADVPPLPRDVGIDARVEAVVRRMLAAEMAARFPSSAEALSAVLAAPGYTPDAAPLATLMGELFAPAPRELVATLPLPGLDPRGPAATVEAAGLAAMGLAETKTLDRGPDAATVDDDHPTANDRVGGRASAGRPVEPAERPRDAGRASERQPRNEKRGDGRGKAGTRDGGTRASGTRAVPVVRPLSLTGSSYVSGPFPEDVLRLLRARPSPRAMAVVGGVAVVVIVGIGALVWQGPPDAEQPASAVGSRPARPPSAREPTPTTTDRDQGEAQLRAPEANVAPAAAEPAQAESPDAEPPAVFAPDEPLRGFGAEAKRKRPARNNDGRRDPTARPPDEQPSAETASPIGASAIQRPARAVTWTPPASSLPAPTPSANSPAAPSTPTPVVPPEKPARSTPSGSNGVTPNGAPVLQ